MLKSYSRTESVTTLAGFQNHNLRTMGIEPEDVMKAFDFEEIYGSDDSHEDPAIAYPMGNSDEQ